MAAKYKVRPKPAEHAIEEQQIWWVVPCIIGCCLLGIIFAYLHVRMTGMPIVYAIGLAVANVVIFLVSYAIIVRVTPKHDGSFSAFLSSLVISLPVFVVGFIGLAYEISVIGDFVGMYVVGAWMASSVTTEKLQHS